MSLWVSRIGALSAALPWRTGSINLREKERKSSYAGAILFFFCQNGLKPFWFAVGRIFCPRRRGVFMTSKRNPHTVQEAVLPLSTHQRSRPAKRRKTNG